MRTALIDGDEIAYAASLRCQESYYNIYAENGEHLFSCKSLQEAKESLECEQGRIESAISLKTKDIGHAYLDNIISKILFRSECCSFEIFLNGNDNFRKKLASLLPYKGNRSEKPFYFEQMKEYLLEKGARSISFLESDDMLSLSQKPDDTVICSTDKDLRTVPGWNYNINRKVLLKISKEEAMYNFYTQLALGDSVDNIPKPYGLGPVLVEKTIRPLYDKCSEYLYYDAVRDLYNSKLGDKTKWYSPSMDIDEILWEIGNLLHMHRTTSENERWDIGGNYKGDR